MIKLFCILLAFLLLEGCTDKTDKKSSLVTPDMTHESTQTSTQTLPDTVETLGNLSWHSNVKEAFTLAKKENKNVIIMVGEDNCRWCVKMKKKTLTDARVQEQMQKYVLVSIKRSDKEAVKFVPEFDGNIPSFFFIDKNKELMESVVGYFNADDFTGYMREIEEL